MVETQAAQETQLSRRGKSLQPALVTASGGVATNLSDFLRPLNKAKVLNNLQQVAKRGVWSSRGIGWTKHRATTFNSGAAFMDFGVFVDSAGTETLLFQVGDKLYSYDVDTTVETQILTGLSTSALPCIKNFQAAAAGATPIVVYTNGNLRAPKQITSVSAASDLFLNGGAGPAFGTTAAALGAKTYDKPQFCQPFYNRMVYFGFTGSDISRDIIITNAGTPATCSLSSPQAATDGGVFQLDPRLGAFKGAFNFRISTDSNEEVLVIGCARGMAIITGSSANDFGLRILTREYGLLSNRAWVQLQNDVFFPSTNGIRRFSNFVSNATLLNATVTLDLADLFARLNVAGANKIHATHNPPTQEVQFWIPIDQTTQTYANTKAQNALVMNYNSQDNTEQLAPIWSTKDGTSVACSIYFKEKWYGGGYDGTLQLHYSGDKYDTGAISWEYVSPLLANGNPMLGQSIRLISVITEGGSQQIRASWYVYERMKDGTMRRRQVVNSFLLKALQIIGTILGSWILGTGAFPSNHIKMIDFMPRGNGRFYELQLRGIDSDDAIDFIGLELLYSVGGTRT